jgi:hypothetical protein
MPQVTPIRVVNPRGKSFSKRRNRRRNSLMGGGELALMTNPKKRRRTKNKATTSRRRRRSNPWPFAKKATKCRTRRRRSNPGVSFRRRSNRRRNPLVEGQSIPDLLKIGVSAAAGGYGARSLTQLVLQANNTGWMGYAANIVASLGLAWVAGKFLGPKYGVGVAAGGISATAIRIWTEQVSQTSPSQLTGLGDLDFSSNGLGDYVQTSFSMPSNSVLGPNGAYVVQNPWPAAAALPATAAAGPPAKGTAPSKPMGIVPVARYKSRFA